MKANGAPEKIYVHIKDKPCEITFSEVIEKGCLNIEYVRTDAFIEKAAEWLDGVIWAYLDLDYISDFTILRNVDNEKFIEDFKKAMTL